MYFFLQILETMIFFCKMPGVGEKMSHSEKAPARCVHLGTAVLQCLALKRLVPSMGRWQSNAASFEKRQTAKWLRCEPFERPVLWVSAYWVSCCTHKLSNKTQLGSPSVLKFMSSRINFPSQPSRALELSCRLSQATYINRGLRGCVLF